MAFNGSGTYQLPAGQPVVTGTTISSTTHNTLANDLATALSLCMTKDGQQTPTANIKFGGYRLTGIGAATDVADAVRASQAQNSSLSYLSSVAGTNTITASATPTPAAYAAGQRFVFIPANTTTGAATLNVSSLGAKDIFYKGAALIGGELRANVPVSVIYDGTQFNIEAAYSRKVQSRSSDTILGVGDRESVLIATATYTQTLTAAATLGDGWAIDIIVDSGATLTIDPNSTETVDGSATKAIVGPAQGRLVCNGALFRTIGFSASIAPTMQVFTSSGTYTAPAGLKSVKVRVVGGGGGSGGCSATAAGNIAAAGGGGGGGYAEKTISAATVGASQTVTVGAGGAAATAGANNGGAGGTSSFGALVSASGGSGGIGDTNSAPGGPVAGGTGGAAGTGSGGDINIPGSAGGNGMKWGTGSNRASTGPGGGSVLGATIPAADTQGGTSPGVPGQNYGGGASGAASAPSQAASAGSAGAPGIVIVEEYY